MIWANTMLIGCAQAVGTVASWLVCRYDPGGNRDGEEVGVPPRHEIAQPTLPNSEVFKKADPNQVIRPRPIGGDYGQAANSTASLFDLGIYAGGAWTTNWFTVEDPGTIDDEYWGASAGLIARLSEDTRLELGTGLGDYDFAGGSFGSGIYWDPISQVTIGGGATYVDSPNRGNQVTTVEQEPSNPPRCDLQYYAYEGMGAYDDAAEHYGAAKARGDHAGMVKSKAEMAEGIARHRQLVEDAVAAGSMSAVPSQTLVERLEKMLAEYKELTGESAPTGGTAEIETATGVEQPGLPPKEVFNPADMSQCPLEPM